MISHSMVMTSLILFVVLKRFWFMLYSYQVSLFSGDKYQSYTWGGRLLFNPDTNQNTVKDKKQLCQDDIRLYNFVEDVAFNYFKCS